MQTFKWTGHIVHLLLAAPSSRAHISVLFRSRLSLFITDIFIGASLGPSSLILVTHFDPGLLHFSFSRPLYLFSFSKSCRSFCLSSLIVLPLLAVSHLTRFFPGPHCVSSSYCFPSPAIGKPDTFHNSLVKQLRCVPCTGVKRLILEVSVMHFITSNAHFDFRIAKPVLESNELLLHLVYVEML